MSSLLEKQGGTAIVAPSMREVALEDHRETILFGQQLINKQVDALILLTGVGTKMLVKVLKTRWAEEEILRALRQTTLICRGPKPVAALKEMGLQADLRVPEPNTWRDILSTLDAQWPVEHKTIAVQEYGQSNPELISGLAQRGAKVQSVALYAWALPEDIKPLEQAIYALCDRQADAVIFTSAQQIRHVWQVADKLNKRASLQNAFEKHVAVASIGPLTTEALQSESIQVDIEPQRPKMGPLVIELSKRLSQVLQSKRAS